MPYLPIKTKAHSANNIWDLIMASPKKSEWKILPLKLDYKVASPNLLNEYTQTNYIIADNPKL
jgi:hypothetical protein